MDDERGALRRISCSSINPSKVVVRPLRASVSYISSFTRKSVEAYRCCSLSKRIRRGPSIATRRKNGRLMNGSISVYVFRSVVTWLVSQLSYSLVKRLRMRKGMPRTRTRTRRAKKRAEEGGLAVFPKKE
jgi:hypothetical protein